MSESLDAFYQQELEYFRKTAADFGARFPKIAGRLNLGAGEVQDPHVERLIQGFAYLNARTRHKLDDSFPELAEAVLGILYPHMLAPVPAVGMVQLELHESQKEQTAGVSIKRNTSLQSERVQGHACDFRTCYPLTLYPLILKNAELRANPLPIPETPGRQVAAGGLRVELETQDPKLQLSEYQLNHLRFYIHMPSSFDRAAELLERLLTECLEVVISSPAMSQPVVLDKDCVQPVGFEKNQTLLPHDPRSFPGYRLLTEYFVLREKFLFFEIGGLTPDIFRDCGSQVEITLLLKEIPDELAALVNSDSVRLNCTPVVNLFRKTADAVPLDQRRTEYRIVPDARAEIAHEIYTIDSMAVEYDGEPLQELQPFYSVRHDEAETQPGYWHAVRRPGPQEDGDWDQATEMYVTVMDPQFSPVRHHHGRLIVELTCFNRNLPYELARDRGQDQFRFQTQEAVVSAVRCLVTPKEALRRHMGRRNLWPLVSQLSLNHLSLQEADDPAKSLREILILNDVKDSDETRNLINGLVSVHCERAVQRVDGAFVRGNRILVELNEENFTGDSAYLFSLLLNRFLGMYTTVNSFTTLEATTTERKSRERKAWTWKAQAGDQALV